MTSAETNPFVPRSSAQSTPESASPAAAQPRSETPGWWGQPSHGDKPRTLPRCSSSPCSLPQGGQRAEQPAVPGMAEFIGTRTAEGKGRQLIYPGDPIIIRPLYGQKEGIFVRLPNIEGTADPASNQNPLNLTHTCVF